MDPAQELSAGEGIEKVGETALKLQFEMCQSEFCFDISQRNVTREDRGRFEIFLAATPEYGRIIVLDPEKTRGYIETLLMTVTKRKLERAVLFCL